MATERLDGSGRPPTISTPAPAAVIRPQFRVIDGLAIQFAESEANSARDAHALLLNPWPESIYAFEPMWSKLAAHAHLVAVDLRGFGGSERRDWLMSPRAMGEFIVRLADEFGLERPHVVDPDIETAAALFAAARHPGRLRSLVIGAGGAAVPLQRGAPLREWVEAPDLRPYRRIEGREIISAVIGTLERYTLSDAAREDYLSAYAGDRFAESMRYVREYPKELPVLGDLLAGISTPLQIIAGRPDQVVPTVNAEFLVKRLPNCLLAVIEAGHFSWEDAADEYAALVIAWWASGYAEANRQRLLTSERVAPGSDAAGDFIAASGGRR
jgi:pimeloyl-ACP methyl ester carboxylesterase